MKKYFVCLSTACVAMMILITPVFSQRVTQAAVNEDPIQTQEDVKADELSIYGEIQSVNAQAASITVQYYDYDSDEEKTLEAVFDKNSKLENVKAIDEIKKGDWVDIICTTAAGKNIVLTLSVDKEDLFEEENSLDNITE